MNASYDIKDLASSYLDVKKHLINKGYAWEIDWQESQCLDNLTESDLIKEAAWVILSSGMSVKSIQSVFLGISEAFFNWNDSDRIVFESERCVNEALVHFNHEGKIRAILNIIKYVNKVGFEDFIVSLRLKGIEFIQSFSYFGPATSYHFAKNIGMNVVKPDRHLIRLSSVLNFSSPDKLCLKISETIGEKISVIDIVLWRYCVLNPNYLKLVQRYMA